MSAFVLHPVEQAFASEVDEVAEEVVVEEEVAEDEPEEVIEEEVAEPDEDVVVDASDEVVDDSVADEEDLTEVTQEIEENTDEDEVANTEEEAEVLEENSEVETNIEPVEEILEQPASSTSEVEVGVPVQESGTTTTSETASSTNETVEESDATASSSSSSNTSNSSGGGGAQVESSTTTMDTNASSTNEVIDSSSASSSSPESDSNSNNSNDLEVEEDAPVNEGTVSTETETPTTTPTMTDIPIATTSSSTVVAASSTNQTRVSTVINDSNRHQFSVNECVSVGDGAFYCAKVDSAPQYLEDGVFAEPDVDGDLEILVRVNGVEQKITDNLVDDSSPYYDAESNRIVWHRLLNDRYQIISYDLDTDQEVILTGTSYNNMEPVAYGDITLWQAWVGNNWEIMMFQNGVTTQLTDNDTHDVAPHMRGGYMVWQTQFADGWKVAVYDEKTEKIEYIEGLSETAIAENPRFVLVFDQIDENGDVRTVGYDFDSKSTIHLGSLPQELPDELPEPDDTGEERALVQTKPSTREGEEDSDLDIDTTNSNTPSTTNPGTSTSTSTAIYVQDVSTSTNDIVIPPVTPEATTTDEVHDTVEVSEAPDEFSDIPDVVIPPLATSTNVEAG